jgi:YggT family protein
MPLIVGALDGALRVLRGGLFGAAAVMAVICAVDWLVRTRRLDPFGGVARFFRSSVHPIIAPVERRVVRAGGLPSSAPWWALVFVVLAGIVLISLLEFVRGQLVFLFVSLERGPVGIYRLLVSWTFAILQLALITRVILSWVKVRPGSWIVRWSYRLSEPVLRPLRHVIPAIGMMDVTPIVAWFLLALLEGFFLRLV